MKSTEKHGTVQPMVVVCAGGGGVGKTTTSAALALAYAMAGKNTLIVTIDPARRLAGAMGVPITDEVTPVPLRSAPGKLFALMPDPRRSMHTFTEHLFEGEPEAKARLKASKLYQGLADAAAGVHELVAMNLVAQASSKGLFDVVVIDTAPSRHAIDFVTYPGRLAALLGGRTIAWLAGLAARSGDNKSAAPTGGILSWGTGHMEHLLAKVTGPILIRDTALLFSELALVRERFVALTQRASDLLLGEKAIYALVAAPTAAARDDVLFLSKRLEKLGRRPKVWILNRADREASPQMKALLSAGGWPAGIADALTVLEEERKARSTAAEAMIPELRKALPGAAMVRLPFVEAATPELIVSVLAGLFGTELGKFV